MSKKYLDNSGLSVLVQNIKKRYDLIEITYSDLKTLRDTSELVPGQQYRIIDYVTTTSQENTQSAGHQFDLIVTADDKSALNENARVIQHTTDENDYFANSDLVAWEIKYCLDNDTDRFAWADTENGKGVIYYMKDEYDNECSYDFKNIMFKHPLDTTTYPNYYYTFTKLENNIVSDATLTNIRVHTNKILSTKSVGKCKLGNNIFIVSSDSMYCCNNTLNDQCQYNVFIGQCTQNILDLECNYNAFTASSANHLNTQCNHNTFTNTCYHNTLDNNCSNNTFGTGCNYNTVGSYCYDNTFGNECRFNFIGKRNINFTWGNKCDTNTIGNYNSNINFSNECDSNILGNFNNHITFGNYSTSNSIGNSCAQCLFGAYFRYNSISNDCQYISIRMSNSADGDLRSYCQYNHFDDNCKYIRIYNTSTASASSVLRNLYVTRGSGGTSDSYVTRSYSVNNEYCVTYGRKTDGTMAIKNLMDLV